MPQHTVETLLLKWPSRGEVLSDARAESPDLDLVAVHRWFQRGSVPGRYWRALCDGAKRRGINVTALDFAAAHSTSSAA